MLKLWFLLKKQMFQCLLRDYTKKRERMICRKQSSFELFFLWIFLLFYLLSTSRNIGGPSLMAVMMGLISLVAQVIFRYFFL